MATFHRSFSVLQNRMNPNIITFSWSDGGGNKYLARFRTNFNIRRGQSDAIQRVA